MKDSREERLAQVVARRAAQKELQSGRQSQATESSKHPWFAIANQLRNSAAVGEFELPCRLTRRSEKKGEVVLYLDLMDGVDVPNIKVSIGSPYMASDYAIGDVLFVKLRRVRQGAPLTVQNIRPVTDDEWELLWSSARTLDDPERALASLVAVTGYLRECHTDTYGYFNDPNAVFDEFVVVETFSTSECRIAVLSAYSEMDYACLPERDKPMELLLRNRNRCIDKRKMPGFSMIGWKEAKPGAIGHETRLVTVVAKVGEARFDKNDLRFVPLFPIRGNGRPLIVYYASYADEGGPGPGQIGEFVLHRQGEGNFYSFIGFTLLAESSVREKVKPSAPPPDNTVI